MHSPDPSTSQQIAELLRSGDVTSAVLLARTELASKPHDYDLRIAAGKALWVAGSRFEAMVSWDKALALRTSPVEAAVLLADALVEQGCPPDAIRIATAVTRWAPADPAGWLVLARAHRLTAQTAMALNAVDAAIARSPEPCDALWHGCAIASESRCYAQAESYAARLLALNPSHPGALATMLDVHAHGSRWGDLQELAERIRTIGPAADPFVSLMDAAFCSDDPVWMNQLSTTIARRLGNGASKTKCSNRGERIRIGYISPDFRDHPVCRMLIPVLQYHDRSAFAVTLLDIGPGQISELGRIAMGLADEHLALGGLSDEDACAAITQNGIDIVVDLAGATTRNRYGILARRPTAAQALWLGCATGTGAGWYDAYILDEISAPPAGPQVFREPVIRLDTCYHPIYADVPDEQQNARVFDDVAAGTLILACNHAAHKVRQPMADAWFRIADACPGTLLWLDAQDEAARNRIRNNARNRGLDPRRLIFRDYFPDHARYLAHIRACALFLDNHPYGAHSTAGEALACGVPVIAFEGVCAHARVAASMLRTLGLPELVHNDLESYVRTAIELCRDHALRERFQRKLSAADTGAVNRNLTKQLERCYASLLRSKAD